MLEYVCVVIYFTTLPIRVFGIRTENKATSPIPPIRIAGKERIILMYLI